MRRNVGALSEGPGSYLIDKKTIARVRLRRER